MGNKYQIPTQSFINLYKKLYEGITGENIKEICPFFPQAGAKWGQSKIKILFVGRAVNGWVETADEFKENLFNKIANIHDQMSWVEELRGEGIKEDGRRRYNSNRSAFWKLIKQICSELNISPWYEYTAWSNMYKLSPHKGNPNKKFRNLQRSACTEILKEEIKILQPTHIIFINGGNWQWREEGFFKGLGLELNSMEEDIWNGNKILYKKIDNILYIHTLRPEFRKIEPHVQKVVEIILKN